MPHVIPYKIGVNEASTAAAVRKKKKKKLEEDNDWVDCLKQQGVRNVVPAFCLWTVFITAAVVPPAVAWRKISTS